MYKLTRIFVISCLFVFGLAACGGGPSSKAEVSTQTLGQELLDLKKAHESGALTDREYEKAKDKLLKK